MGFFMLISDRSEQTTVDDLLKKGVHQLNNLRRQTYRLSIRQNNGSQMYLSLTI